MKYDTQLTELKTLLPTAKSILIAIPANANIDQLAAGLALFLILESNGKQATIVSNDNIKVGQSYLFGVDHVQKNIPSTDGGNLTISLEGVATPDKTVPALEKLDWYAENNNLNLVFHVLPGQTFQPTRIVPHYQGSGFNLIFVVGAVNLTALGNVYSANAQAFSGTHIVNIDNEVANTSFGQTNIVDTNASSISEIMSNISTDLGFNLDADTASNILAGIFDATKNLTDQKASADTFMAVANCLRAGGKKPSNESLPTYDWNALANQNKPQPQPQYQPVSEFAVPPVVQPQVPQDNNQPSPEERPAGEGVISETVEPEWLTPKIFKGSSIG